MSADRYSTAGGHAARRRHRDVPREGARQGALRDLRHVDARGRRGAAAASSPISRHAIERQSSQLYYQPIVALADGAAVRIRSAAAMAASDARAHRARSVHSASPKKPGSSCRLAAGCSARPAGRLRAWDAEFPECREPDDQRQPVGRASACSRTWWTTSHGCCTKRGLAPRRLKLEITESLVLESSDRRGRILNALRALGVQLGLDDFGIGYSALSYLQRLPVPDAQDRSLVRQRHGGPGKTEIMRAIVSLAAGLAMNVTAEGVETAEQAVKLEALACDHGQGYLLPSAADARTRAGRPARADMAGRHSHRNLAGSAILF